MAIKIVEEPDVHLTREEYERLHAEWERCMMFNAAPVSFNAWVARKKGLVKSKSLRERIQVHND
jgi:hypothetical protein